MIKVLVIDDEPLQRQGIVRLTPWNDFDAKVIGSAGSGMEGILLAREHRPDLVIVDIKMPGLSGLDVIAHLREELEAEYIILSGYGEFEFAQQAIALGVCAYLLKPLDDDDLAAAMRQAAARIERRHRELYAGAEEKSVHASICRRKNRYVAIFSMPFAISRNIWRIPLRCARSRGNLV